MVPSKPLSFIEGVSVFMLCKREAHKMTLPSRAMFSAQNSIKFLVCCQSAIYFVYAALQPLRQICDSMPAPPIIITPVSLLILELKFP